VTKQQPALEKLRTSEIRYRRLFEAARDGILILDIDTLKITDVNPFMTGMLGYSREEFLGKELWEIGLFGDKEASQAVFRELQETGYIRYDNLPLETKRGNPREVEFVSNVYEEDGGQVIQCNIRDITERKMVDEQTRRTEHELDDAQRLADVGSWNWDLQSNKLIWSDEHFHIFGLSPGDIELAFWDVVADYIHPDDRDSLHGIVENSIKTLAPFSVDYRVIQPDGNVRIVHSCGEVAGDEHGNPVRMYGSAQDVTEARQTETERAQLTALIEGQSQRLDNFIACVPGVVWEAWSEPDTAAQRNNFVSDQVETMLGYTVEEWLATPNVWLSLVDPDDREQTRRRAGEDFARGQSSGPLEFCWVAKNGRSVRVETNYVVLKDNEGQPVGFRGVTIDISRFKNN